MAQYSGIFTTTQQMQAKAASNWPSPPDGLRVIFAGISGNDSLVKLAYTSNGTSFSLVSTGQSSNTYGEVSGVAYSESLNTGVVVLTNGNTSTYTILKFTSVYSFTEIGTLSNFYPSTVSNTGPANCFYKDGYFYIIGNYTNNGTGVVVAYSADGTNWSTQTITSTGTSPFSSRNAATCMTKTDDGYFIIGKMTSGNAMTIYYGTNLASLSSTTKSTIISAGGNTYLGGVAGKAGTYVFGLKNYTSSYAGATMVSSNLSSWTVANERTIFTGDGCFNTAYYPTIDLFYFYGGAAQAVYSSSNGTTLTNLTGSGDGYAFCGTYSQFFNKIFKCNYNGSGAITTASPSGSTWTQVLAGNNYTWGAACASVRG